MLNVEIETTINVELSSKFELGSVFINASIVEAVNGMGNRSLYQRSCRAKTEWTLAVRSVFCALNRLPPRAEEQCHDHSEGAGCTPAPSEIESGNRTLPWGISGIHDTPSQPFRIARICAS